MSLLRDPIVRAIYREMKEPIGLLIEKEYYRAALILMVSSIDALAHIGRADGKPVGDDKDFKAWVQKYLLLDNAYGAVTPDDWWSFRNGLLHTHSPFSLGTEAGKAKYILFSFKKAPVRWNLKVPDAVMVSIESLRDALYRGIDRFLVDVFAQADDARRLAIETRIRQMMVPMTDREVRKSVEGQDAGSASQS